MANSHGGEVFNREHVVNCFQISNFVLWQTAKTKDYEKADGCELLSN